MSRVFWDTNLYIYLFEEYGNFSRKVRELRSNMLVRGDQLLTSTLTLGGAFGKAFRGRRSGLVQEIRGCYFDDLAIDSF